MQRLDFDTKLKVTYCIPLWLRDEQIKLSIGRVKERIQPHDRRDDAIAVVGYGPSLQETWEKIKEFSYVISCSGATRFLIEKGIVPQWHVAVDPQPKNTVALIGQPHKDVEYLISSTCHPDVFDHLEGYQVKLWHVFSNEVDAIRTLPAGEWAITGGCDVGLRCLTLARFMGFYKLHVFGLDGCYGKSGRHAGAHPVPIANSNQEVEYGGQTYITTAAMLAAAKMTCHELAQLPDVEATFYGEGLTQALAKDRASVKLPKDELTVIAFAKPALISTEYASLNAQLHRENPYYGVSAEKHLETVLKLAASLKTKNILDYGCGKGLLGRGIPWNIDEYDPAIPGKEELPKPADLVCCIDVLEHVEPDRLMLVLADLKRCVQKIGYFTIHTGPAKKTLPDGRNTHLIQEKKEWWAEKLSCFFEVGKIIERGLELHVIVAPRKRKQKKVPMSVVPEAQEMAVVCELQEVGA